VRARRFDFCSPNHGPFPGSDEPFTPSSRPGAELKIAVL